MSDDGAAKFDEKQSILNRKAATELEMNKLSARNKIDKYSDLLTQQKSWEKVDKKLVPALKLADRIESLCKELAGAFVQLNEGLLDLYHTAPEADTGLALSPLSRGKVFHYLKTQLIKGGLSEMGTVSNIHLSKSFKESIQDGAFWLTKLKSGEQLYGTIQHREQQLAVKRKDGK